MSASASQYNYLLLHGYKESATSMQADFMKQLFDSSYGVNIIIPNLNPPEVQPYLLTDMIKYLEDIMTGTVKPTGSLTEPKFPDIDYSKPWRLIGISLGGLLASILTSEACPRTAKLVDSLLLLCPGFNVHDYHTFSEEFKIAVQQYPAYPIPSPELARLSKVVIIHGSVDTEIPISDSQTWISKVTEANPSYKPQLIVIEGAGHQLGATSAHLLQLLDGIEGTWFA